MAAIVELESTRATVTGQFVLDNIGDKPNQPVLYNFPKWKFGQVEPVLEVYSRHGSENGHGCIMIKGKIRYFVTFVVKL